MIWWSESDVYFQRRCRLKFFLPYGSMLTKTKKKTKTRGPWTFTNGNFLHTYFIVKDGLAPLQDIRV